MGPTKKQKLAATGPAPESELASPGVASLRRLQGFQSSDLLQLFVFFHHDPNPRDFVEVAHAPNQDGMGTLQTSSGASGPTSGSASSGPTPAPSPDLDPATSNLLAFLLGKEGAQTDAAKLVEDFRTVLDPKSESKAPPSVASGANPERNSETCS